MSERELFEACGVKLPPCKSVKSVSVNKLVKTERELWIALGVTKDKIADVFCEGPGVRGPRINARSNGHRAAGVDPANGVYPT